jgi:hypothetical protein
MFAIQYTSDISLWNKIKPNTAMEVEHDFELVSRLFWGKCNSFVAVTASFVRICRI